MVSRSCCRDRRIHGGDGWLADDIHRRSCLSMCAASDRRPPWTTGLAHSPSSVHGVGGVDGCGPQVSLSFPSETDFCLFARTFFRLPDEIYFQVVQSLCPFHFDT